MKRATDRQRAFLAPGRRVYAGVLVTVLLIGFVATSLSSYFVAHDSLADRIAEETLPLTSDNIYSEIQRDLLRSVLISSLMAHDTFVRDWTLAGENDPQPIIRYLREIQRKYGTTTTFFVSEDTRRYYHPNGVLKTISRDDPGDAWYFRVRRMNRDYEINVDSDTADRSRLSIFVNYRVTDYEDHYLGAIGIGLSVNSVTRLVESYQQRYGRQIYFVDRQGEVRLHGSGFHGPHQLRDRPGLARYTTRILANPSTSIRYTPPSGTTTYLNSRLVPELAWYLVVEQTESAAETRILDTFAINIAVALGVMAVVLLVSYLTIRGYQRRLEEMATTDKLTGAASRQVFDALFDHQVKAARRHDGAVSLVAVDIDRFKALNDTYGHQGGDVVIRGFVEIVRRHIRESDTLCRWGGDEFVLLLGSCNVRQATDIAEEIREAVIREPVRFGREDIAITVSLGVAERHADEELDALITRADEALYESKHRGRNSVTTHTRDRDRDTADRDDRPPLRNDHR